MSPDASPTPASTAARSPRLLGAALAATVLVAGSGVWAATQRSAASADAGPAPTTALPAARDVATPALRLVGVTGGRLAWQDRLEVRVRDGELTAVSATGPDGEPVEGALTPGGSWRAEERTVPATTYRLSAEVRDSAGGTHTLREKVRSTAASALLTAGLSPGDDRVVGVGQPVVLRLDRPVEGDAAREALEERLEVRTSPEVEGAWRWTSSSELHYRGASFWQSGTEIDVVADLQDLPLPGGVWGSGRRTTSFSVGAALTSVVDVDAHTMTVSRGGKVLRVLEASMGKPGFATRNGTFLVLEKFEAKVMDSDTLVLPPGEAAYQTAVEHAVRISNSGTFTHGAPWSVASQGRANVSHGCINLSPADAKWYFDLAQRGDVVEVVGSTRGPLSYDAGSMDWNMSFAEWRSDS